MVARLLTERVRVVAGDTAEAFYFGLLGLVPDPRLPGQYKKLLASQEEAASKADGVRIDVVHGSNDVRTPAQQSTPASRARKHWLSPPLGPRDISSPLPSQGPAQLDFRGDL